MGTIQIRNLMFRISFRRKNLGQQNWEQKNLRQQLHFHQSSESKSLPLQDKFFFPHPVPQHGAYGDSYLMDGCEN